MTVIIDYGVGNLFSLTSSLASLGETVTVSRDADVIRSADRIILPGVGAFEDAAKKLRETGLVPVLRDAVKDGKPLLGICLGMQLLFEKSYEYGEHEGLGFIGGSVIPLAGAVGELKVPHMGWNALKFKRKHPLFKYVNEGDHVYFVHSYYAADCEDSTVAVSEYGVDVTAAVAKDNVMGCQFHPEKSGEVGLKILKAFCEIK